MKSLATALACVLVAGVAVAQEKPDTEKRIAELEKQLALVLKEKDAPMARLASGAEAERTLAPVGLSAFYDNGYLVGTSNDGKFKYWLDGRVNLDTAWYTGAENRLPHGSEVRRGRIGLKATLFGDWLGEVDLDFADNLVEIKDMWVGYAGFKDSVIRVGNHKAPFGFDSISSSKNISFMERAYIDAWAPDRLMGVSYSRWGKNWQGSVGVFGQAAGDFNDKDSLTGGGAGTDQGWGMVGRFSYALLNENGKVLHLGLAGHRHKPDVSKIATSGADLPDRVNASKILKLDSRAETHVLRAKFLSTGDMKYVDNWVQFGGEVAGVFGPVNFQAEYQSTKVNRIPTAVAVYQDHTFKGYYGQVSWFITGERRPYSAQEGEFGRLIPTSRYGALELALRYSTLDLNDETAVDAIRGGSAKNITLGLNWHINANHKLMLNFTKVNNDEFAKPGKDWAPIPAGTSTTLTPVVGDDFNVIALRYQLAF